MLAAAPSVSANSNLAKPPQVKFYNFDEMLIDGEIKKPTALLTDVRARANFDRMLDIKKSFLKPLFNTAREKSLK